MATKYYNKAVERKKVISTIKEVYKMCDTKDIDDFKAILIEAIKVLPSYKEESK